MQPTSEEFYEQLNTTELDHNLRNSYENEMSPKAF